MKISLIAAMSQNRAIGYENALPWSEPIPVDWENLYQVTAGKKMIMGRKSYDNPHRVWSAAGNFVVTRQEKYQVETGFEVVKSLEDALEKCQNEEEVFVIGGEEIFRIALPLAHKIVLTLVYQDFKGDAFFPEFNEAEFEITEKKTYKAGNQTPYDLEILTMERV